ncbi:MAG: MFS transporter [bacterium]
MKKKNNKSKWLSLVILSSALAIVIIDGTVLNVSLKNVIEDLKTDYQSLQWVITSYSLVIAALTITGGRLGDIIGRKKMFMLGATLFGIGSLISALSVNVTMLMIGWSFIEGIGAALMLPATISLVTATFKGRERAIAFGVWGGIAGASSAVGPILGGYLTSNFSWHWAFMINVVLVIFLNIGAILFIKDSRDTKEKFQFDFIGFFTSAIGMMLVVYGIIESTTYGWVKAKKPWEIFSNSYQLNGISISIISLVLGFIILGIFLYTQNLARKKNNTPLINLEIFKNRSFSIGILTTAVIALGQAGLIFSLPIFLQSVRNLDAFHTGLAFLPMSIPILIVSPLSASLSKKISPKYLIQAGIIISIISSLVLRNTLNVDTSVMDLVPGLFLFGIGFGLISSQITNITMSSIDVNFAGEASGLNSTMRQLGSTLGTAIIGAIFISTMLLSFKDNIETSQLLPAPLKTQISSAISTNSSQFELGGTSSMGGSNVPQIVTNEISLAQQKASATASKNSMIYTTIFYAACLVVSFALPHKIEHQEE